ncbi:helix-turn-helix transcriptional regulator [Streptomyces sp. NPDC004623]|uniref:helix-turn-helix domain-containing protein n=1 Tax=Streptomyces sp. NPDC004623 TaxID=3156653 RepID=UPI0033BF3ABF
MSNSYGDWFKEQRVAAGLTQQELADAAVMTRSHIPSKEDARRLDKALNTGNVLSSFLPEDDGTIADYFEAARQLERQATMIREYALTFMPGILQTERYARAVLSTAFPPRSEAECDRHVVTRLERAQILADPVAPVVWALLDEATLRRPAGSPEIMAEQIMHVVHLGESGRVRVHVLPLGVGIHPISQGMVSLMSFEDQPPVAYSEGLSTGKIHESPAVVARLQDIYALALSDALPQRESLAMLRAAAKEYEHEA